MSKKGVKIQGYVNAKTGNDCGNQKITYSFLWASITSFTCFCPTSLCKSSMCPMMDFSPPSVVVTFMDPFTVKNEASFFALCKPLQMPKSRRYSGHSDSLTYIFPATPSFFRAASEVSRRLCLARRIAVASLRLTHLAITIDFFFKRCIAWKSRSSTFTPACSNTSITFFSSSAPSMFSGRPTSSIVSRREYCCCW